MLRQEHTFTREGRTYICRTRMAGVSAAPPPAKESNAYWAVTVDGVERRAFDADPDDLVGEQAIGEFEQRVIAAMAPYGSE